MALVTFVVIAAMTCGTWERHLCASVFNETETERGHPCWLRTLNPSQPKKNEDNTVKLFRQFRSTKTPNEYSEEKKSNYKQLQAVLNKKIN